MIWGTTSPSGTISAKRREIIEIVVSRIARGRIPSTMTASMSMTAIEPIIA
jgi:hypothetical protein